MPVLLVAPDCFRDPGGTLNADSESAADVKEYYCSPGHSDCVHVVVAKESLVFQTNSSKPSPCRHLCT